MGDNVKLNIKLPEGYALVSNGRIWQLTKLEWVPAECKHRPRTLMQSPYQAKLFYSQISAALYADRHAALKLRACEPVRGPIQPNRAKLTG